MENKRQLLVQQSVAMLLDQYREYEVARLRLTETERYLARKKLSGVAAPEHEETYRLQRSELQKLSDAMTFMSPTIWLQYKNQAYKHEAQPIDTMHDLRMHCKKPGYICTKRFTFLNQRLAAIGLPTLEDKSYADTMLLEDWLRDDPLRALESTEAFIATWRSYELYAKAGRVAKWENY